MIAVAWLAYITHNERMKIAFIASEAAPFAKVGGLGDVISSLPPALIKQGHLVSVLIPGYSSISGLAEMEIAAEFDVPWPSGEEHVILRQAFHEQTPFFFLENPRFLTRERVYGYPDDPERFAFFSRAALEVLRQKTVLEMPEVLHVHDWHTSPVPLFLASTLAADPDFAGLGTVLSIHNLSFQGITDPNLLVRAGVTIAPDDERVAFYGQINLLKGAILTCDMVGTVSQTYAHEILGPALGMGLEGVLNTRRKHLFGITNGIDTMEFNPAEFGWAGNGNPLAYKRQAKSRLQARLGLVQSEETPLMALVSRLCEQKGIDLFPQILERLMERDLQVVVLGAGEPAFEQLFQATAARFPGRFSMNGGFQSTLAREIYAGADIFLMPSRFEPCGLGQMIALHYGTVPVVRKTGGLADTVFEYDPDTEEGNGFLFQPYEAGAFLEAIMRAIAFYQDKTHWKKIVKNGMAADYSWSHAVPSYEEVYRRARFIGRKRSGLVTPSEIRKDPILEEWTIIAKGRTKRPSDFKPLVDEAVDRSPASSCPFCAGHELETPDELFAIRPPGSRPNGPGWEVRVLDNKYPALIKEEEPVHSYSWLHTSISGFGAHEVIVETPEHNLDLADLPPEHIEKVLQAYRQRYRALSVQRDLRYILVFRNRGRSAGASLHHPHAQLIATPIVPRRIKDELEASQTFYEHTGQCIYCALLKEELSQNRLVLESESFLVFEPYASRFPFETTLIPKEHEALFGAMSDHELHDLASVLSRTLLALKKVVHDPPYNLMIHSAPLGMPSLPSYHWHVEVLPRLTTPAGFEWGTDFYINPTPPEEAARFLREAIQDNALPGLCHPEARSAEGSSSSAYNSDARSFASLR